MAKIVVHAVDWPAGTGSFMLGSFGLPTASRWGTFEGIAGTELAEIEVASEEGAKRIGGALAWGTVGALALGPVGLLAGLLLGGKERM